MFLLFCIITNIKQRKNLYLKKKLIQLLGLTSFIYTRKQRKQINRKKKTTK